MTWTLHTGLVTLTAAFGAAAAVWSFLSTSSPARWRMSVLLAVSLVACAAGVSSYGSAAESSSRMFVRFKSGDGFTYYDSLVLRNNRTAVLTMTDESAARAVRGAFA